MARAKATIEPQEQPAEQPAAPVRPSDATTEPTTVSVIAQTLAEVLASYAFSLASFGAATLSPEGIAAFTAITTALCDTEATAQGRYDVPAAAAFWLSSDLMGSRHKRPVLTAGEVALGNAVSQQAPKLAQRLAGQAAKRTRRPGAVVEPRPLVESPVLITEPQNARFPHGQYTDGFGRPTGPKPLLRSTL
ncbi:hypothetical protein ABIA35_006009 [Catenulispora sp. MAP12-49]|uniref:hypothetical protein n=1 Tax=Catenulispora sp. MAP12-49 TaxID=3156302 RepID=UPI0035110583